MSEYTSTIEGYQRAMELALSGPPHEAKKYVDTVSTPNFYHIDNGQRVEYDVHVKTLEEWRGKITDYKPVVQEFLRDGDKLAARMTGTVKVSGADCEFESNMFAKIDSTGRMEWLKERAVWGPAGKSPDKGIELDQKAHQ